MIIARRLVVKISPGIEIWVTWVVGRGQIEIDSYIYRLGPEAEHMQKMGYQL